MEKIQFGESEQRYPIESIQPVALHVMRIIYAEDIPEESAYTEPMTLYSNGGVKESTLTGWETIYYQDDQTVYVSDDGSVWAEPEETEPQPETEPEPYEPTVEELQTYQIAQMQSTCNTTIHSGIDIEFNEDTIEHFSLTMEDQFNLLCRQLELDHGSEEIDYHADGELSKYYSAEDMQKIINDALEFIDYENTYCNELCLWIKTLTDKDEIQSVYYGMEIPEAYRSPVLNVFIDGKGLMKDLELEPEDNSDKDAPLEDQENENDDDTESDENTKVGGGDNFGDGFKQL